MLTAMFCGTSRDDGVDRTRLIVKKDTAELLLFRTQSIMPEELDTPHTLTRGSSSMSARLTL